MCLVWSGMWSKSARGDSNVTGMLLTTKDVIFLFCLGRSVGRSVDGSVCHFTAQSVNTRSPKFLEESRRWWLGPRERDGSDGSSHGRGLAARASAGMKCSAWQTAGTWHLSKFPFHSWELGRLVWPLWKSSFASATYCPPPPGCPRQTSQPLSSWCGWAALPCSLCSLPTGSPDSSHFLSEKPRAGVFHHLGFAPPQTHLLSVFCVHHRNLITDSGEGCGSRARVMPMVLRPLGCCRCLQAPRSSWDARAAPAMPASGVSTVSRAVQSTWHCLPESSS